MNNYELEQALACKQMQVEDLRQQLAEQSETIAIRERQLSERDGMYHDAINARDIARNQVMLLRDALKCYAHISYGFYWSPVTSREEPRMVAKEALAPTDDLDQYILCKKEPVEAIALEDCVEHSHRVYGLGLFAINDAVVTLYRAKE